MISASPVSQNNGRADAHIFEFCHRSRQQTGAENVQQWIPGRVLPVRLVGPRNRSEGVFRRLSARQSQYGSDSHFALQANVILVTTPVLRASCCELWIW